MFSADNSVLLYYLQRFKNQIHRVGKYWEFMQRKIYINVVAMMSGVRGEGGAANENRELIKSTRETATSPAKRKV